VFIPGWGPISSEGVIDGVKLIVGVTEGVIDVVGVGVVYIPPTYVYPVNIYSNSGAGELLTDQLIFWNSVTCVKISYGILNVLVTVDVKFPFWIVTKFCPIKLVLSFL